MFANTLLFLLVCGNNKIKMPVPCCCDDPCVSAPKCVMSLWPPDMKVTVTPDVGHRDPQLWRSPWPQTWRSPWPDKSRMWNHGMACPQCGNHSIILVLTSNSWLYSLRHPCNIDSIQQYALYIIFMCLLHWLQKRVIMWQKCNSSVPFWLLLSLL